MRRETLCNKQIYFLKRRGIKPRIGGVFLLRQTYHTKTIVYCAMKALLEMGLNAVNPRDGRERRDKTCRSASHKESSPASVHLLIYLVLPSIYRKVTIGTRKDKLTA